MELQKSNNKSLVDLQKFNNKPLSGTIEVTDSALSGLEEPPQVTVTTQVYGPTSLHAANEQFFLILRFIHLHMSRIIEDYLTYLPDKVTCTTYIVLICKGESVVSFSKLVPYPLAASSNQVSLYFSPLLNVQITPHCFRLKHFTCIFNSEYCSVNFVSV